MAHAKVRPRTSFIILGLSGYLLPVATVGDVPFEAYAYNDLDRLAHEDPVVASRRLGLEGSVSAVGAALGHLRASLEQTQKPDVALDLFRKRVHDALPKGDPGRRAALLTLMMALGTVRRHLQLPFDHATMAELD